MQKRHNLTLQQYQSISHLLPGSPGKVGPNVDNHRFLNAIFWYLKTGCPWRDLPSDYGHWKIVHRRFSRWCKSGVFQKVFQSLLQRYKDEFGIIQLDSSAVKAHQHAAGAKKKVGLMNT
jgi:transposase